MSDGCGAVVFDFDNTLTKTDTVKLAVLALMFRSPMKLPRALVRYQAEKKTNSSSENVKHSIIGELIMGMSPRSVDGAMSLYHCLVMMVRNRPMWTLMLGSKKKGEIVLVATASPKFAVERVLRGYSIPVIGTEYETDGNLFTGKPVMPVPFGENKASKLALYMKKNGIQFISRAYSDSSVDMPILQMARNAYLVDKSGTLREVC